MDLDSRCFIKFTTSNILNFVFICNIQDRSDSFDFNVALQDHFKYVKNEEALQKEKTDPPKPQLDLGFKEGETIKINMKITVRFETEFSSKLRSIFEFSIEKRWQRNFLSNGQEEWWYGNPSTPAKEC